MLIYSTYAALSRSVCALPLDLIWSFETTSNYVERIFTIDLKKRKI